MSELYNQSYDVSAYNTEGSLISNAYTFQLIVDLLEQTEDLRNKLRIKWYCTGNRGFGYTDYSNMNVTLDLKKNSGNYTRIYSGTKSTIDTGVKTLIATYENYVSANEDGTLTINVKAFFDGGVSVNYLPRRHTKETGTLTLPTIDVNVKPFIKINGHFTRMRKLFIKVLGHFHLVKRLFKKVNGHWERVE